MSVAAVVGYAEAFCWGEGGLDVASPKLRIVPLSKQRMWRRIRLQFRGAGRAI